MTLQSAVLNIGFGVSISQNSDGYGSEVDHLQSTQLLPFGSNGVVNILEEDRRTRQAQVERTGVRIRRVSPNGESIRSYVGSFHGIQTAELVRLYQRSEHRKGDGR